MNPTSRQPTADRLHDPLCPHRHHPIPSVSAASSSVESTLSLDHLHARKMCAALQTATVGTRTILLRYEDDVDSLGHIIVGNPGPPSDLYQGNGYRECGFEWFDDTCLTVLHWQCTRESGPVTPLTLSPSHRPLSDGPFGHRPQILGLARPSPSRSGS